MKVLWTLVSSKNKFLEEYCTLLGKLMYGNVDTALLWLILIVKYLINKYKPKRTKGDYCIFFKKYDNGKLELLMSVHVDDVFTTGKPETLDKTKEMITHKINIEEYSKVKNFSECTLNGDVTQKVYTQK